MPKNYQSPDLVNKIKLQPDNQIYKYYDKTNKPNNFKCKQCQKQVYLQTGQNSILYSHILASHRDSLVSSEKTHDIKQFIMSPPKKQIQNQVQEVDDYASDQWIDRLALDGYPVQQILSSILMRYRQDSVTFGKYLCRRAKALRLCKYKVKKYLPTFPINTLPSQIIPDLVQRYRISEEGANLLIKQYFWCNQDDDLVFHELQRRGIIIKHYLQDRINKVILLCTQSMKKNYNRFGDTINLQFRNNMIIKGKIGFLMGQDTNILPTLFGILIIQQDRKDLYKIGLQLFLQVMKKRIFQTIITNDNQNILLALQQLKQVYKFKYFINWYYVFKNLKQKLNQLFQPNNIQQYIILFQKSLIALTIPQLHQQIRKITVMMDKQNSILCQFLQKSQLYCMSKAYPTFMGFGIQIQRTNIIHKILDIQFNQVPNLGHTLLRSLRVEQKLMQRLKNGYKMMDCLQMRDIIQLHYLRRRMQYSAFKKVLLAYWSALQKVKIVEKGRLFYKVIMEDQQQQLVKYIIKQDCWKCSCKLVIWSGLPCSHLIKILIQNQGLISYYINKRWFIISKIFDPNSIFCQEQTKII